MAITDKIKAYFEPDPNKVRVRDVVRELPNAKRQVEQKVGEFAVDVAQGTARAVGTVAVTGANNAVRTINQTFPKPINYFFGKKLQDPFEPQTSTANSKFAKVVFGETPVKTIRSYGQTGLDELDKLRAQIKGEEVTPTSKAFAIPLGILGVASELTGYGGPSKKAVFKLGDEVVDVLTKTGKTDDVAKILKESTDLNDEAIKIAAPKFAFAKTADEVKVVADELMTKEQGFVTSVKNFIPDETKVSGQRIIRNTDELAIKAKNLVDTNEMAAINLAEKSTKDDAVAVTSELIKKWTNDIENTVDEVRKNDLYTKISELTTDMANRLTEAGRFVQAASILQKTTPEGQLKFAAKTIENYNRANPTKTIPGLSAEDSKYIIEEMKAIQAMPDDWQKAHRFDKLQDYTLDKIPTPLWKKMTTVWQAGLLTGIKTTGLNLASNSANILAGTIAKIPATIIDSGLSLLTNKRSVALSYGVTPKGLKEGWEKGIRFFMTGFDERKALDYKDLRRVSFGKGRAGKLFQGYTDIVFRLLGAQDQLFYYGANTASLLEQAKIQAINSRRKGADRKAYQYFLSENPTEEMVTAAAIDATAATFQNKTKLGTFLSSVRSAGGPVGEVAIPFARTPAAVAMEVLNYTPVGTVRAMYDLIKNGKNFNQREFSTLLGKSLTGAVPLWFGFNLAKDDKVNLEYPLTPSERNKWEAEGRVPNTILINGKWRSPMVLGPAGFGLLWGAHYERALKEKGSPTLAILDSALSMGKTFIEQTALSGINSLSAAISDPIGEGSNYVANLAGSMVPTLVADVAKTADPYQRDLKTGNNNIVDNVLIKGMARIPGVRQTLPEKIDTYGYKLKRAGNIFEAMADPTRPSKAIDDVVINEIHRLWKEGYKASPTKIKYYPSLSPEDQSNLFRYVGTKTEQDIKKLMMRPSYRAANDEDKANMIDKVVTTAKIDGRAVILLDLMKDIPEQKRVEKLAQLKQEQFLTNAVYVRYKELR